MRILIILDILLTTPRTFMGCVLFNSKKTKPDLTLKSHFKKVPLPLPIREFLDFFDIIKFGTK